MFNGAREHVASLKTTPAVHLPTRIVAARLEPASMMSLALELQSGRSWKAIAIAAVGVSCASGPSVVVSKREEHFLLGMLCCLHTLDTFAKLLGIPLFFLSFFVLF